MIINTNRIARTMNKILLHQITIGRRVEIKTEEEREEESI